MKQIAFLLVTAVLGTAFAGWTIRRGNERPPAVQPVVTPATSSFAATVAGAGLVEPAGEAVLIGSPLGDVIAEVPVAPGQAVEAGAVLFRLDDRLAKAQEAVAAAAVTAAQAGLATAATAFNEAAEQAARVADRDADLLSIEERSRRGFAVAATKARMAQAEAAVAQAEAAMAQARTELDRRTVRAPRAGTIMRVNARAGEFAPAGRIDPALVTLGDLEHLHLRVDIDENDAWRVQAGAKADGAVRGNPQLRTPLEFVRIEPYVVPKKSLTGLSSERVDTRVLQVVYRVAKSDLRLYAGQQMDVFIDTAGAP